MNNKLQKVLEKLESNGFEAYIVGGYVRDYLLGIKSTDIDIATNALPKDIMRIFDANINKQVYGSVAFKIGEYSFDITTYRSEESYENRRPVKVKYVDNLITDIKRRDFTINSLCMNSTGNIIDLLDAKTDIDQKTIRVIGDVNEKLTEDPLRILRAIRFAVTLNFDIDEAIIKFINNNGHLITTLSYYRKEEELSRMLSSKDPLKALMLLRELNLLDVLGIDYPEDIVIVPDILGIWAQMQYDEKYPFTKSSKETIEKIRKILAKGKIDNLVLFKDNLYISTVAGKILGYTHEEITKMYNDLPIKTPQELKINNKDIFTILNIEPSPKVKIIYQDVLEAVLNGKLPNDYDKIKIYIEDKWRITWVIL